MGLMTSALDHCSCYGAGGSSPGAVCFWLVLSGQGPCGPNNRRRHLHAGFSLVCIILSPRRRLCFMGVTPDATRFPPPYARSLYATQKGFHAKTHP